MVLNMTLIDGVEDGSSKSGSYQSDVKGGLWSSGIKIASLCEEGKGYEMIVDD
jgi:hypothetical protein